MQYLHLKPFPSIVGCPSWVGGDCFANMNWVYRELGLPEVEPGIGQEYHDIACPIAKSNFLQQKLNTLAVEVGHPFPGCLVEIDYRVLRGLGVWGDKGEIYHVGQKKPLLTSVRKLKRRNSSFKPFIVKSHLHLVGGVVIDKPWLLPLD